MVLEQLEWSRRAHVTLEMVVKEANVSIAIWALWRDANCQDHAEDDGETKEK